MWLIALLLLFSPQVVSDSNPCGRASSSASAPIQPPFLIVQVVDPSWLPLPGAAVTVSVRPVTGKKESKVAHTMGDGDAKFWIPGDPGDADYTIEANYGGFKTKRLKGVHLGTHSSSRPTAYVQVQLQPVGPPITVY
jgi:hypothetical protein